jgi:hypothetical protein
MSLTAIDIATQDGEDQLYELVNHAVDTLQRQYVWDCILACHNGRLEGPFNQENLHLVRQFRNRVSGEPDVLIEAAARRVPMAVLIKYGKEYDQQSIRKEVGLE